MTISNLSAINLRNPSKSTVQSVGFFGGAGFYAGETGEEHQRWRILVSFPIHEDNMTPFVGTGMDRVALFLRNYCQKVL